MKLTGPCLCGDPACPHCGHPPSPDCRAGKHTACTDDELCGCDCHTDDDNVEALP